MQMQDRSTRAGRINRRLGDFLGSDGKMGRHARGMNRSRCRTGNNDFSRAGHTDSVSLRLIKYVMKLPSLSYYSADFLCAAKAINRRSRHSRRSSNFSFGNAARLCDSSFSITASDQGSVEVCSVEID